LQRRDRELRAGFTGSPVAVPIDNLGSVEARSWFHHVSVDKVPKQPRHGPDGARNSNASSERGSIPSFYDAQLSFGIRQRLVGFLVLVLQLFAFWAITIIVHVSTFLPGGLGIVEFVVMGACVAQRGSSPTFRAWSVHNGNAQTVHSYRAFTWHL
jgi:hypothetical protein